MRSRRIRVGRILAWCVGPMLGLLLLPRSAEASVRVRACDPRPTEMTIEYGDLIMCKIDAAGDFNVFRFTGAKDEVVNIETTTTVLLLDLQSNRIHNARGLRLPMSGTYTIRAMGSAGEYSLSLDRIWPLPAYATRIYYGEPIQGSLRTPSPKSAPTCRQPSPRGSLQACPTPSSPSTSSMSSAWSTTPSRKSAARNAKTIPNSSAAATSGSRTPRTSPSHPPRLSCRSRHSCCRHWAHRW